MKPIHRRAVGLAEPGATPFAMVTLTASQRAVSHHVRRGTLGIGAGWFDSRGAHLGSPYSPSVASHVNRVTTGLLPGARSALWITYWLYIPAVSLISFVFLLFPDGRLPSPRWRPVAWLVAIA